MTQKNKLPGWTWIAPLVILLLSAYLSELLKAPTGSLLFYLPIPVGLILIHWWGPRVLLGSFLTSLVSSSFWNQAEVNWLALVVDHETICLFVSWYVFSYKQQGKIWLPDILSLLRFIGFGIILPVIINALLIYLIPVQAHPKMIEHLLMVWTADFASSLAITLPVLFFLTPCMERLRLSISNGSSNGNPLSCLRLLRPERNEMIVSGVPLLAVIIPLEKYWFVLGLFCIYVAVRFGFGHSLIANIAVFLFTYILPYVNTGLLTWTLEADVLNVHFGMCLLGMTACITGRVISDLKLAEQKLSLQFSELQQTNHELDRFVYSVSHDLSAPIKSIQGLIAISRLEKNTVPLSEYIDKVELCANRLDRFIRGILDYSRNSRVEESKEVIILRDLVNEIIENLKQVEPVTMDIDITILDYDVPQIKADKMRMTVILNNLLSNAMKYQCVRDGQQPIITIQSEARRSKILIRINDNGQGIRPEHLSKVFNMFFRGSDRSLGAGLGLYIAKEAAEKMNGKITVRSIYGEGSEFIIHIPVA